MSNLVFDKTIENVRKHRNIRLVNNDIRKNYLESETNYYSTNRFSENLLAKKMRKT